MKFSFRGVILITLAVIITGLTLSAVAMPVGPTNQNRTPTAGPDIPGCP